MLTNFFKYYLFFFTIPLFAFSQTLKDEDFNELYFSESFDNNRRGWLILNSQDNFFIIKDGYYELQRRNEKSSDIVLCPFTSKISDYQLSVRFALNTTGVSPTFSGLIFNATKDGTKALAFEVSTQREFRIRKLNGTNWIYLTSGGTVQGWQKTNAITSTSAEYELLVQTKNDVYDFYINGIFVSNQTISNTSTGDFGITLGPASKVKADELTLMTTMETAAGAVAGKKGEETAVIKNDLTQKNMTEKEKQRNANQSDRITELDKELEQIKKKVTALEEENAVLKNQDENARVNQLNKTIMDLQAELNKSYQTIDNLKSENQGRISNPEMASDSGRNKPLDEYIYQKYTKLVKENITLKNELDDAKGNGTNPSSPSNSSSEIVALKEKIRVLEEQLRMSNQFNLNLLKEKNSVPKTKQTFIPSDGEYHVVQKGETLYSISKKYPNLTVKKIMQWNGMNDNKLELGQKLRVR